MLRWNDDVLGGTGFVDWYPFEHPQLGPVELGGWDFFRTWSNAPAALMEAEVAPHSTWAVAQALALPELAIHDVRVTALGDDTWHVRVVVKNAGWLPTNVTQKATSARRCVRSRSRIELPDGARLATGRPVGRGRPAARPVARPHDARDVRRRLRPERGARHGRLGRARAGGHRAADRRPPRSAPGPAAPRSRST